MAEQKGDSSPVDAHGDAIFADFVRECGMVVTLAKTEEERRTRVAGLTGELASVWRMPDPRFLRCDPNAMYASYLLYCNPEETLNVVLDVFLPGQAAVIHNHRCWCVFTCLEGVERERLYRVDPELAGPPLQTEERICPAGHPRSLGSARNLFHQVECATNEAAVSLHIYGADIGRLTREMWDAESRKFVEFRSGYSNDLTDLPPYMS